MKPRVTGRWRLHLRRDAADTEQVPSSLRVLTLLFFVAHVVGFAALPASAAAADGSGKVHAGLYSDKFAASSDLDALAAATGKRVSIGGTFDQVVADRGTPPDPGQWSNTREQLDEIWRGGAVPFVNLYFPGATSAAVANGSWDADFKHWLAHARMYLNKGSGRVLILAPLQEMNGSWVPYGCTPSSFKTAYRRLVDIVRQQGLDETKVRFAWAPNGVTDTKPGCGTIHDYYPGDGYVDLIGISAYRWWDGGSVQQIMGGIVDDLAAAYPTKPIVIAQTAAWPSTSKSQWIRDMFDWAASHSHVVGIIYFNFDNRDRPNESDWRVWANGSVDPGWRDAMKKSTTVYQHPLSAWFQPGPLVLWSPPGKNLCQPGKRCDTMAARDTSGRFRIFEYAASGLDKVDASFIYGRSGDIPLTGDWNGDGHETIGLYRQSDGFVYLKNSNSAGWADVSFFFGRSGDVPIVGDFDGDGKDTVSVYRPSEGKFYIKNQLGDGWAEYSFVFGRPGDKPLVGNFDSDPADEIGLHRESTGLVYFRYDLSAGWADAQFVFGKAGDVLVAGDWDGDGRDTVGVYRPSNGRFYVRNKNSAGNADTSVYIGPQTGVAAIKP